VAKQTTQQDAVLTKDNQDIILYSGQIEQSGYTEIVKISRENPRDEVTLILNTVGGDPNAAYKIAKYLQSKYKKFTLFIACICKSAGTLIAMGAHELVFSESGELGPLDVQLRKDHEIGLEYTSGLDMISALNYLNTKTLETFGQYLLDFRFGGQLSTAVASRMATPIVTALYESLYRQIDPVKLGDITRSMEIASAYALRLAKVGKNLKDKALPRLVSGYPSHSFVIDFDEAKELFVNIRKCTDDEAPVAFKIEELQRGRVALTPPAVVLLNPKSAMPSPVATSVDGPQSQQASSAPRKSTPITQPVEQAADNSANETQTSQRKDGGTNDIPPAAAKRRHRSGRPGSASRRKALPSEKK